jgi:hypothetical protein
MDDWRGLDLNRKLQLTIIGLAVILLGTLLFAPKDFLQRFELDVTEGNGVDNDPSEKIDMWESHGVNYVPAYG